MGTCITEVFIWVSKEHLTLSSTPCICDKVISGHIKRSSNLDEKGRRWLEDRTNICFWVEIFTPDECAEAVFASVV